MRVVDNRVHLGGVDAAALADQFGTPLFVIDEGLVRARFRELYRHITYRPLAIHYACKANPNIHVIRALREEGSQIDACSPGDVYLALRAGFRSDQILYTGYAVSEEELRWLIARGIFVNMDSLSQMERYGRLKAGCKVGLRVNPGVAAGFHPHVASGSLDSKLGIHPAQMDQARDIAKRYSLTVTCLHMHIGSDILEISPFRHALGILLDVAREFDALESLDVGGGWGVPYGPDEAPFDWESYGRDLSEAMEAESRRRGRRLTLRIEPGTYLVGEAVYLLTRVVDIKRSVTHQEGCTPTFVGTDTSLNHLLPAAIYGAYHQVYIADRASEDPREKVSICGNLVQAGDVLARNRPMPEIREGNLLVFKTVGAYTSCRGARFNERPLPAEVIVAGGEARLSRRRETLEDLVRDYAL